MTPPDSSVRPRDPCPTCGRWILTCVCPLELSEAAWARVQEIQAAADAKSRKDSPS